MTRPDHALQPEGQIMKRVNIPFSWHRTSAIRLPCQFCRGNLLRAIATLIVFAANLSLEIRHVVADKLAVNQPRPNIVIILADDKYGHVLQSVEFHREYGSFCDKVQKSKYRRIAGDSV